MANFWFINPVPNTNSLQVNLASIGSGLVEYRNMTVPNLDRDSKFWYLDQKYQKAKWQIYSYGGKMLTIVKFLLLDNNLRKR